MYGLEYQAGSSNQTSHVGKCIICYTMSRIMLSTKGGNINTRYYYQSHVKGLPIEAGCYNTDVKFLHKICTPANKCKVGLKLRYTYLRNHAGKLYTWGNSARDGLSAGFNRVEIHYISNTICNYYNISKIR